MEIWLIKADCTVEDFNSVYCNKYFENSKLEAYKDIVSMSFWNFCSVMCGVSFDMCSIVDHGIFGTCSTTEDNNKLE